MTASAPSPPPAATAAVEPIPFRQSSPTSMPEVAGILVTTLVLLAAVSGLAWWARRQGWLDRWVGQAPKPANGAKDRMVVLETLRISPKTTLYRVQSGQDEFIVGESVLQIELRSKTPATEPKP